MVSVCIATYNGEKYIKEQLTSILCQLDDSDEVIVSDDHSTDKTLDIVRAFNDIRIRITQNPHDHCYPKNFENALKLSKGDYIFISDQDDIWMENKIQIMLQQLCDSDLVVSDAIVVDSNKHELLPSFYAIRKPKASFFGNILKFGYLGCCLAMKRNVVDLALPFPRNYKLCTHDNWIFLIALTFFKVKILDVPLIMYRRHDGNISSGAINAKKSIAFRIHYRVYLLWNILIRAIRFIINHLV
jgi:glycosyltransferase involved in cell wall biosynthesis